MRRAVPLLCFLAALSASAGCGREEDKPLAPACREGPSVVLEALRAAPREVRMDGTPLSECLENAKDGGQLRDVGTGYVIAAQQLADRAQRTPESRASEQLGYLVGALRRGSRPDQGLAYELVRRVEGEASRADHRSVAFRRGLRAGREGG
jgi:hypothetical protein